MGRRVLAGVLLAAALTACAGAVSPPPRPMGVALAPPHLDADEARDAINAYRAGRGLHPLTIEPRLTLAARAHAEDLARHGRISHTGSDGSNPWQRVHRAGYLPRFAAENVATGQGSLEEALAGWRASRGHNANLLSRDATQMGIALAYDPTTRYRTYWALVLGTPRE